MPSLRNPLERDSRSVNSERTNYGQTSLLEVLDHETKKYEDEW